MGAGRRPLPMPPRRCRIDLDLRFTEAELERIRLGHEPEEMGDKWRIVWQKEILFLHRS